MRRLLNILKNGIVRNLLYNQIKVKHQLDYVNINNHRSHIDSIMLIVDHLLELYLNQIILKKSKPFFVCFYRNLFSHVTFKDKTILSYRYIIIIKSIDNLIFSLLEQIINN